MFAGGKEGQGAVGFTFAASVFSEAKVGGEEATFKVASVEQ